MKLSHKIKWSLVKLAYKLVYKLKKILDSKCTCDFKICWPDPGRYDSNPSFCHCDCGNFNCIGSREFEEGKNLEK